MTYVEMLERAVLLEDAMKRLKSDMDDSYDVMYESECWMSSDILNQDELEEELAKYNEAKVFCENASVAYQMMEEELLVLEFMINYAEGYAAMTEYTTRNKREQRRRNDWKAKKHKLELAEIMIQTYESREEEEFGRYYEGKAHRYTWVGGRKNGRREKLTRNRLKFAHDYIASTKRFAAKYGVEIPEWIVETK